VQLGVTLIAGAQTAEVVQPCEGALDDPPLGAQARAMLDATPGDRWLDTARSERPTVLGMVIAAVGEQPLGSPAGSSGLASDRADPIEQREQLGDVIALAASECDPQRDAVSVGDQMML